MALFDFSRFNFFNKLDARARMFVLLGGVIAFVLVIYLLTRYFSGGEGATGASRVAAPPAGLQSVPGGNLTPEYQRTLEQANVQTSQQAAMTGASAIPTTINYGSAQTGSCIVCSDQNANIKSSLDKWAGQGKLTPDVIAMLEQLANNNVPLCQFAAELDNLIRGGKMTPDQARELVETYNRQHNNQLLQESGIFMDSLIKGGRLPLDAANTLMIAQKNGALTPAYSRLLQGFVSQGRISPADAQELLVQYTQLRAKEIVAGSICSLREMGRKGQLTPDVLKDLVDLETRMVAFDVYANTLEKYLAAGKITPVVSRAILDEYNAQKAAMGTGGTLAELIKRAEQEAYQEISDLLKSNQITLETANLLREMIKKNVAFADFEAAVAQMVEQKKLTPEISKLKLADYKKIKDLRDLAQRLGLLEANNASDSEYADELKRAVASGIISPQDAAMLLQEYQALRATNAATPIEANSEEFARLQQQLQQSQTGSVPTAAQFVAPTTTTTVTAEPVVMDQDRAARIQALMTAMAGQAQQLVSAWEPPTMRHTGGPVEVEKKTTTTTVTSSGARGPGGLVGPTTGPGSGPVLIKAGTILFGVLDTAVNSDYPDSPVLVTIVTGPLKGSRLLGKLTTAKNVAGQLDRVALNFTLMNFDAWPASKTVTAYAIDPDTARSVMASSVNYHYFKRFGAIMATSFLQGYSTAITNAGTSTTGIFGTSTTHNELNPSSKIMVGLGQIGQNLGSLVQNWINIPPTVRVDSGVGLGILFMSDVT